MGTACCWQPTSTHPRLSTPSTPGYPMAPGEPDGSYQAMEFQPGLDVARRLTADAADGPPGGGHYSLVLHAGDIA